MPDSPNPSSDPSSLKIGWIGTGVMGASMCQHFLNDGYRVTIFTRSKVKADPLMKLGGNWADSPKAVAEQADVIFTMVGYPQDVREVYFEEKGLLSNAKPKQVFVDMTTSEPMLAKEIAKAANAKGAYALDAPVSGGDVGAKHATLSIMIGGETEAVRTIDPLFKLLGHTIVHQGGPGAGQHTKLSNQIACAGTMIGVCEALLYGYQAGLTMETMINSIRTGAAACWTLDHLAPRILQRNFDPGFFVDHFLKDLDIALKEAKRMNLVLPGLTLARQLYQAVQAHGHGKSGTHALILALEHLSDCKMNVHGP